MILYVFKQKGIAIMKALRRDLQVYNICYFLTGLLLGVYFVNTLLRKNIRNCNKRLLIDLNENKLKADFPLLNQYDEPFLLIGVMTTRRYLKTRATAISRTWGKHIPGKIFFFLGQGREYKGNLPVVVLDDVSDDAYPPQRKSFAMLKYMHDNYIDTFEWFMRVDDDIFIQPRRLERFLRSVNSSRRLYMGQPGLGVPRERGKLGLRNDSFFFCMGGTGIIFTKETLRRTAMGLNSCLKHTFTKHEDTELGRCVNEQADVSCSAAYEVSMSCTTSYKTTYKGKHIVPYNVL